MQKFFEFLSELKENNNREWFHANKTRYDELYKDYIDIVQQLISRISAFDSEIAPLDAKSCVFRIYRDTRFSNDKTPYKTHFGAFMAGRGGKSGSYGGYYFHLEPGNSLLCGGSWRPDPPVLRQLRLDIYGSIEDFVAILEDKKFRKLYGELDGDTLKKTPAGFPKDLPEKYAGILKHKDFSVWCGKPDSFFSAKDWMDSAVEDYRTLYPFNRFLNYTIGEFYRKA